MLSACTFIFSETSAGIDGGGDSGDGGASDAPPAVEAVPCTTKAFGNLQQVVVEDLLADTTVVDDPTLTQDGSELFYNEQPIGSTNSRIFRAVRDQNNLANFVSRAELELGTPAGCKDTGPELSHDGKTLYFASDRPEDGVTPCDGTEDFDVWVITQDISGGSFAGRFPERISELASTNEDLPSTPFTHSDGTTRMIVTLTSPGNLAQMIQVTKSDSAWINPQPLPLQINEPGVRNLAPYVSPNGLTLLFNRSIGATTNTDNIIVATRNSLDEGFSDLMLLGSEVNDGPAGVVVNDNDPWLSPDGCTLYFASKRLHETKTHSRLWVATREPDDVAP
jgi:Tol biopolymer transport system component